MMYFKLPRKLWQGADVTDISISFEKGMQKFLLSSAPFAARLNGSLILNSALLSDLPYPVRTLVNPLRGKR